MSTGTERFVILGVQLTQQNLKKFVGHLSTWHHKFYSENSTTLKLTFGPLES